MMHRQAGVPITIDWMFEQCSPVPFCGCWLWTRSLGGKGPYGQVWYNGRMRQAHVVACELVGRTIPEGRLPDHLCRVTICINPDHIEPVTYSENVLRGARSALKKTRTHCLYGHPFSGDNRYEYGGKVFCRTCARTRTGAIEIAPSKRTHCPLGHAYSDENTYISRGHRQCRECMRRRCAEWRERNRK